MLRLHSTEEDEAEAPKPENTVAELEEPYEDEMTSTDDEGLQPSPEQIAHDLELRRAPEQIAHDLELRKSPEQIAHDLELRKAQ